MPKSLSKEALIFWATMGVLCLLAASALFLFRISNLKGYDRATAKVVGFEDYVTENHRRNIRPRYEVTTDENRMIKFTDPRSRSRDDCDVKIGDVVPVLYRPENPSDIMVDDVAGKYGLAITLFILGVVHTGIPTVILFSRHRKRLGTA